MGEMGIHVTKHAIERFQQRVAAVDHDAAIAALTSPAIQTAVEFGARHVILGGGQRVVIAQGSVVTVLTKVRRSKGCARGNMHNG